MPRSRLPRTSYGYLAPPDAQVRGWACNYEDCGVTDDTIPQSWPYPCRECGRPADPWFAEPWHHESRIHEFRHRAATAVNPISREIAEKQALVWAYRDAGLRGDQIELARAWRAWHAASKSDDWPSFEMVMLATRFGDFTPAASLVLEYHPRINTRDVEDDNTQRAIARSFVSMGIELLTQDAFLNHPDADAVDAVTRDVATRIKNVLNTDHEDGLQRAREVRDRLLFRDRIRRIRAERVEGLPSIGWPAPGEADAAIEDAEIHDNFEPLDRLISRGDNGLLTARRLMLLGDLDAADSELKRAASTPQVLATRGLLLAHIEPGELDAAIDLCRRGRAAGLGQWRLTTPADAALARLLLIRALSSRPTDIDEAVTLISRRCRPWSRPTSDDRLLRQEALAARDLLTGNASGSRRQADWTDAVAAPGSPTARMRLAMAWAQWAAGTNVPEFAAEAYEQLVTLAAEDAAARRSQTARDRALLDAQEYTEEAGYWLARAGQYRKAVLALEMGRAVADSHGGITYSEITAQTSDGAIVYLAAAQAGGYAMVVAATHEPQYVDLPDLDRGTVADLVRLMLDPLGTGSRLPRDLVPADGLAPDPVTAGLEALWNGGLHNLMLRNARGRIVTLIPIGLLTLLPLHAAGRPADQYDFDSDHRHLGQFSAIRFVPNIRALRRARATCQELDSRPASLLAVDVADAPLAARLNHVARETTEVTDRWVGAPAQLVHGCTWDEFRAVAEHHTVWHLACHGDAEPADILNSRLYFADRQVTLAELAGKLKPNQHRLAVLSACRTNVVGAVLPNEVVGLPSALLRIGFAGVIATSWAVDDLATTYLMTAFYEIWCRGGEQPAVALNRAQQWLRTATRTDLRALLPGLEPDDSGRECPYGEPRFWAAFAYTGV